MWVAFGLVVCFAFVAVTQSQVPTPVLIGQQDHVENIYARHVPVHSDKLMPPVRRLPSPSAPPQAIPVDVNMVVIGNEISHRHYLDYPENLQIVMPGLAFNSPANITKWELYAGRDCRLNAQVFRPTALPLEAYSAEQLPLHAFELVGENVLFVDALGKHEYEIDESSQIHVQPGDVLGFFTSKPGCISWSRGGTYPVQYRYGSSHYRQIPSFAGIVTVGEGELKTYSFACTCRVDPHVAVHEGRPSPSASATLSYSASPSPSVSPVSPSPSMTPIHSKSSSASATASQSWTPSVSRSPSVTPSPSVDEMVCTRGLEVVCMNKSAIQLCNLTEDLCSVTLDMMNIERPEFLKSPAVLLLP